MEELIKAHANHLLMATGLADTFPVPVEKIAEYLGFRCHFYVPEEDVNDIAAAFSHQKKTIYVNQSNSLLQQRWCIACKLACIILYGEHQDYVEYLQPGNSPEEYNVTYFAENLLMPEAAFKQKWFETNRDITELVRFFGVNQFFITGRASALKLG